MHVDISPGITSSICGRSYFHTKREISRDCKSCGYARQPRCFHFHPSAVTTEPMDTVATIAAHSIHAVEPFFKGLHDDQRCISAFQNPSAGYVTDWTQNSCC